jgi:hypothetical protein
MEIKIVHTTYSELKIDNGEKTEKESTQINPKIDDLFSY